MHSPWVRLSFLYFSYWFKDGSERILSVFGTPLFTDVLTAESKGGGYARACVEVRAGTLLLDEAAMTVKGVQGSDMMIRVDCDWNPALC